MLPSSNPSPRFAPNSCPQADSQDRAVAFCTVEIYKDAGPLPALVPTIPSVRSSIVSVWGLQCMECVPLMPSNAWHDQGADSTSQVWCLPHISINFSPIFLIFKTLFAMLPPTKLDMREGICLNQKEGRRVACPACLVPVSEQEARPRISPLLRFLSAILLLSYFLVLLLLSSVLPCLLH